MKCPMFKCKGVLYGKDVLSCSVCHRTFRQGVLNQVLKLSQKVSSLTRAERELLAQIVGSPSNADSRVTTVAVSSPIASDRPSFRTVDGRVVQWISGYLVIPPNLREGIHSDRMYACNPKTLPGAYFEGKGHARRCEISGGLIIETSPLGHQLRLVFEGVPGSVSPSTRLILAEVNEAVFDVFVVKLSQIKL